MITDESKNKFLGLTMQNNLSYDAHLSTGKKPLLPAVRRQMGMISRLSTSLSQKARNRLITSLAISKLTYAISIWGNTTENLITRAQTVLNIGARIVTGLPKRTKIDTLMKETDWLNIAELTQY